MWHSCEALWQLGCDAREDGINCFLEIPTIGRFFKAFLVFFSFLLCITSSCGLLSGVAAGGIISPGVLVGCLQEAEMIIKPILNDLFGISTSRTNTFFCIFTDLNSIAVNHYRARHEKGL